MTSIAFPAISTGIHGYPQAATEVAVQTVRDVMRQSGTVLLVVFACFDQRVLDAYRAAGV